MLQFYAFALHSAVPQRQNKSLAISLPHHRGRQTTPNTHQAQTMAYPNPNPNPKTTAKQQLIDFLQLCDV